MNVDFNQIAVKLNPFINFQQNSLYMFCLSFHSLVYHRLTVLVKHLWIVDFKIFKPPSLPPGWIKSLL